MTATIASKALHLIRIAADLAAPLVAGFNPIAGAIVTLVDKGIDLADDAVLGIESSEAKIAAYKEAMGRTLLLVNRIIVEVPSAVKKLKDEVAAAGPKDP